MSRTYTQRYDRCRTIAAQVGYVMRKRNKYFDVYDRVGAGCSSPEPVLERVTLEDLELFLAKEAKALIEEGGEW